MLLCSPNLSALPTASASTLAFGPDGKVPIHPEKRRYVLHLGELNLSKSVTEMAKTAAYKKMLVLISSVLGRLWQLGRLLVREPGISQLCMTHGYLGQWPFAKDLQPSLTASYATSNYVKLLKDLAAANLERLWASHVVMMDWIP